MAIVKIVSHFYVSKDTLNPGIVLLNREEVLPFKKYAI